MHSSRFFNAFTAAINWNAFFYLIYKVCFIILTFILYKHLPPLYFSQWATTNSIIFLLLLWLNCGLKKSIPRFAPFLAQNTRFHKKFVLYLLLIKSLILLLGLPILIYLTSVFMPVFPFMSVMSILFITEGLTSLLLLIYHAHFWQKQFNLIQALFLLLEIIANALFFTCFHYTPTTLVSFLFISKIIANTATTLVSLAFLPLLYKATTIHSETPINQHSLIKHFLKHSFVMWTLGLAESLSERNFLFPFITAIQGNITANLFKVIHDSAIFFQRIAIRTMGVADTALLSYIEATDNRLSQFKEAFTSIFKTMFLLCIPLLGIGTVLFFKNHTHLSQSSTSLFLIVALATVFEMILSPYTRVLEVKFHYKELILAYTPYLIGYAILMALYAANTITLLPFIAFTHLLRIIGLGIMVYYAKQDFNISFPLLFTLSTLFLSLLCTLSIWFFF